MAIFLMRFPKKFSFLLLLFLPVFWAAGSFAQAVAPPAKFNPVILGDQTEFSSPQQIFVIRDQNKSFDFASIIKSLNDGSFAGKLNDGDVVSLGSRAVPHWIIIPVRNNGTNDIWNFDLGDTATGRISFAMNSILYDTSSGRTFFNTSSQIQTLKTVELLASRIPIKIDPGKNSYLILYVQGMPGTYGTIRPGFYSSTYHSMSWIDLILSPKLFFLFAAFGLIGAFFAKRNYAFLATAAMWLLMHIYCNLLDKVFLIDTSPGPVMTPLFWTGMALLLLFSLWLTPGSKEELPGSLFVGMSVLSVAAGILGPLSFPYSPAIGLILSYCPILIASALVQMVGWSFILARRGENYAGICLISLIFIFTTIWMSLINFELIGASEFFSKYYYWLLSTAAFGAMLLSLLLSPEKRRPIRVKTAKAPRPTEAGDGIREAREMSEHKRLLHVLEQERETMKEMQILETRRTEEMRKSKEAADEANRAKSAFLAVVSHEIRTPMTGIMGMVKLLQDTTLSREQKEFASTIQDSSEALLALLNDILDFEKIESGKLELERLDFDLRRLLRGINTLMMGHAASKNIDLILDIDPSLPDYVIGDPVRLRQVILNLVNNAIKFTPKGIVRLQVKNLTAVEGNIQAVNQIYFGVQDSGIGINPDAQKKLFMPFAQADASTSRKFGGTGLGLAICKRLIEAMGGAIGINSREGEGSTFFFTLSLPLGEDGSQNAPVKIKTLSDTLLNRQLKILVVDDNGINQKVLQGLLSKHRHEIILASTAEQAIQSVRDQDFDLVLMDIELPGKSGLEAAREIRAFEKQQSALTPIIAMTGNVGSDDIEACMEAGMDDFLPKPVMPDQLQQILLKTVHGALANPDIRNKRLQKLMQQDQPQHTVPQAHIELNDDEDIFAAAVRQFEQDETDVKNNMLLEAPLPAAATDSLLNDDILNQLLSSLGLDPSKELLLSFYETADDLLDKLEAAYGANDAVSMSARAHELKGMAGNFGFKALSEIAGEIETAGKGNVTKDTDQAIKEIRPAYEASREEMSAWLKAREA